MKPKKWRWNKATSEPKQKFKQAIESHSRDSILAQFHIICAQSKKPMNPRKQIQQLWFSREKKALTGIIKPGEIHKAERT